MTQVAATAPQSASAASRWRHFLAIDEREAIIAFAQTAYGRGLIALLVLLAVWPHFGGWASIVAVAAAMAASLKTAWRNQILCAATWLTAFAATWLGENDTADNIASVLAQEQLPQLSAALLATGFLALLVVIASPMFYWIRSAPQSLLAKRPLVTLLLLETAACLVANLDVMQGRPRAALWSAIFVFTPYLWFLPYAIVDQRSRTPSPMLFQMAILRPFWSPSYLSFNKGAAFLNKHLAKTPNDLAVTQLKAVKLLLWANVLYAIRRTGLYFRRAAEHPSGRRSHRRAQRRAPVSGADWLDGNNRVDRQALATDRAVGASFRRHRATGGLSPAARFMATARLAHADGLLQPLPLLLQGISGRFLFRTDFLQGISRPSALAHVLCHLHGRRRRQCALAFFPGHRPDRHARHGCRARQLYQLRFLLCCISYRSRPFASPGKSWQTPVRNHDWPRLFLLFRLVFRCLHAHIQRRIA